MALAPSSPPTRGCSFPRLPVRRVSRVLSADAGVFRADLSPDGGAPRPPRRRGGVPSGRSARTRRPASSPPTRGCSAAAAAQGLVDTVLPADAGVFRNSGAPPRSCKRPPCRRGGVPHADETRPPTRESSPPTRGCSDGGRGRGPGDLVLPADVPTDHCPEGPSHGPPRRRGRGVLTADAGVFRFRARTRWRCAGPPRIRGGVPQRAGRWMAVVESSPPTRGCSARPPAPGPAPPVLPADAGVFRSSPPPGRRPRGPPRRRGGVPTERESVALTLASSPPTRGCSVGEPWP